MRLPQYAIEWANRAERHFMAAEALKRRRPPLCDHVCYYSREAAENYMKALLLLRGIYFSNTVDLGRLLDSALRSFPLLESLRHDLLALNPFDISFLYPGAWATLEDARLAIRSVRRVRKALRKVLGVDSAL